MRARGAKAVRGRATILPPRTQVVPLDQRTVALRSSGALSPGEPNRRVRHHLRTLARLDRPSVCLVPTASGDDQDTVRRFHEAYGEDPIAPLGVVGLFDRSSEDLCDYVLRHDIVLITGGNTVNALAIWREHGFDRVIRRAWERGIVVVGASAGGIAVCSGGVSDSFGPDLAPVTDALALVSASFCPHYELEARQVAFRTQVADGTLAPGLGIAGNATVVLRGDAVDHLFLADSMAFATRVLPHDAGAVEEQLRPRPLLGPGLRTPNARAAG